jgi:hypothetical protein
MAERPAGSLAMGGREAPVHGELLICPELREFLVSCYHAGMRDLVSPRAIPVSRGVSVSAIGYNTGFNINSPATRAFLVPTWVPACNYGHVGSHCTHSALSY